VFVPEALQPGALYTVTVNKGIPLSGSSETLKEEHVFAFETQTDTMNLSPHMPWLRVYQKLQEVRTTEPPLVQLSTRNIPGSALDVAVYPLNSEQEYLDILAKRDRLPWWAYAKDSFTIDNRGPHRLRHFPCADPRRRLRAVRPFSRPSAAGLLHC